MTHTDERDMALSQNKELIDKIRNLINTITDSKYISHLNVIHEDDLYVLRLGLNSKDASPISLGFQGDEDSFLKFLEKEFRKRKLQNIQYTKGTLINGDSNVYYPIIEL